MERLGNLFYDFYKISNKYKFAFVRILIPIKPPSGTDTTETNYINFIGINEQKLDET